MLNITPWDKLLQIFADVLGRGFPRALEASRMLADEWKPKRSRN